MGQNNEVMRLIFLNIYYPRTLYVRVKAEAIRNDCLHGDEQFNFTYYDTSKKYVD